MKAVEIKKHYYNSGNVNFELQIKENSEVVVGNLFGRSKSKIIEPTKMDPCGKKINKKISKFFFILMLSQIILSSFLH